MSNWYKLNTLRPLLLFKLRHNARLFTYATGYQPGGYQIREYKAKTTGSHPKTPHVSFVLMNIWAGLRYTMLISLSAP